MGDGGGRRVSMGKRTSDAQFPAGSDAAPPGPGNAHEPLGPRYKWVALTNTTAGVLLATIDASIMIIAMPDIFRGIKLNPLVPGNSTYLLWMILGYLVTSSVLVVSVGRLGDLFGRTATSPPGAVPGATAGIPRLGRDQGWRPSRGPNDRSTWASSASASQGPELMSRMIGSGLLYSETS